MASTSAKTETETETETENVSNKIGPDLFGLYKHQITGLLNNEDNFPNSSSNFDASVPKKAILNRNTPISSSSHGCSGINSFGKCLDGGDLLKSCFRQCVTALTHEVDEMIDPVMRIRHIIACLKSKSNKNLHGKSQDLDSTSLPCKKQKLLSLNGDLLTERKKDAETEPAEDNEDLKLLLRSEISVVEEIMTKQSNEHYAMLNHMELQLEELLGAVSSKCRRMTRQEKQQLQKLIKELPPRNLDRIVEIIHHGKSFDSSSLVEIAVDLEQLDNDTLWRLYFYTRAVEGARKLAA